MAGGTNTENVWSSGEDSNIPSYGLATQYLGQPSVRRAIHIGNLTIGTPGLDQYAMTQANALVNCSWYFLVLAQACLILSSSKCIRISVETDPIAFVFRYHAMIVSGDVMNSSKVYMEGVLQAGTPVLVYNGAWDGER